MPDLARVESCRGSDPRTSRSSGTASARVSIDSSEEISGDHCNAESQRRKGDEPCDITTKTTIIPLWDWMSAPAASAWRNEQAKNFSTKRNSMHSSTYRSQK